MTPEKLFDVWFDEEQQKLEYPSHSWYDTIKASFLAGMVAERAKHLEIFGRQFMDGVKSEKEIRDECKRTSAEFFERA